MAVRRIVIFEGEVLSEPHAQHFAQTVDRLAGAFGLSAEIVEAPLTPPHVEALAGQLPPGYLRKADLEELAQDFGNTPSIATRLFHAAVTRGRDLDQHPSSQGRHVIMTQGEIPEGVFVHRTVFDSLVHGPRQTNCGSKTRELAQAVLDQSLPQPTQLPAEQQPIEPLPQMPRKASSISLTFDMAYLPEQH